jgi:NADH-quinone oxidoreductase subunit M
MPWLTLTALVPLAGAAAVWLLPASGAAKARTIALAASLITLAISIAMAVQFAPFAPDQHQYQFTEVHPWIPLFGVSYALGVNAIGLIMVLLSTVLVPVCIVAGWDDVTGPAARTFFALILVLETFMVLVFAARDLFLFYVVFEAMLVPVYFLIGLFGGAQRKYAAVKFLLYSLLGGLVMLVAVIGVYYQGPRGARGFLISNLTGLHFASTTMEQLLFLGFFFAFAIKAPMWPVHTWLPDAAAEAPAGVAVLLVGVLDKVGTFGMLTLCIPLFPGANAWAAPVIIGLAVVSVIYGALLAIGQSDLKRLIAYTSISHFGFIVLGIYAFTSVGQSGATLYMLNHGFSTAALFLIAGMLIARRGSAQIADFGGLQRSTPLLAGVFLIAGLSSLAMPGLSSFVSEVLVLIGTFQTHPVAAVIATLGIILASLYILLTYQKMFTGPEQEYAKDWLDLSRREVWVVAPLIAVIVVLGFYPKPVLDVINPAVARTMNYLHVTDPQPVTPVATAAEGTNP